MTALAVAGVAVLLGSRSTPAPGTPDAAARSTPVAQATSEPLDPALFAAGSCVALGPTKGDRKQTVFLDAGHGGPDPGGQGVTEAGRTIFERDMTLPVVLKAADLLRADGYRVVVSRTTDGPVAKAKPGDVNGGVFTTAGLHRDVALRAVCANLAKAAALVSVHYNIGASPKNAGARTVYNAVRPFSAQSLRLATQLQDSIVQQLHAHPDWNIPDVGVTQDGGSGNAITKEAKEYGHLLLLGPAKAGYFTTPSLMPGALVEPLFLTDPFEGSLAASPQGQLAIASGIATAVTQFLTPTGTAAQGS